MADYVNDPTVAAYGAIFRVFLAYTAYEVLLVAVAKTEADGASLSESDYNGAAVRLALEGYPMFRPFLAEIRDIHDVPRGRAVRNKIENYLTGAGTMSVTEIGKAVRNAFSHGKLASAPTGTSPQKVRQFADTIADHILGLCDGEFTKAV